MNQTIEKRKIPIPFIILGARPTSTPSPKRDQLVLKFFFGPWFALLNAWNINSALAYSSSKDFMTIFQSSLTWYFRICQFWISILLLEVTFLVAFSMRSCKDVRFSALSTSSTTTNTFFDINHCLILQRGRVIHAPLQYLCPFAVVILTCLKVSMDLDSVYYWSRYRHKWSLSV